MKKTNHRQIIACLFFLLLLGPMGYTQQGAEPTIKEQKKDWLLVRTTNESDFRQLQSSLSKSFPQIQTQVIAPNFHLLAILNPKANPGLHKFLADLEIPIQTQQNRRIQLRRYLPDDELYQEQWALRMIRSDLVWQDLKGGFTALEDEIVLAIIDDGISVDHPDLKDQIWVNPHEIPSNGLDDDGNGFIDDVSGWNFKNDTGIHSPGAHGSPVAGIMAASTDNQEGVASAAFNAKILPLSPAEYTDEIYASLNYIFDMRDRYNQSGGEDGAFIVASNTSLGVENAFPNGDLSMWCDLIDSLGKVGVISVTSATNQGVNIEEDGDMPALCGSPNQITVTRTNRDDIKNQFEGGYSAHFVHIGAPGDDILTTDHNGGYRRVPGTSASAPFVSGTIGLLYSLPCPELVDLALSQPNVAASSIRNLIINHANANSSLEDITTSGGRLDVYATYIATLNRCKTNPGITNDLRLKELYPNPVGKNIINVQYDAAPFETVHWSIYDMNGRQLYNGETLPAIFSVSTLRIYLEEIPVTGLYLLRLQQNEEITHRKFVVTN